MKYTVYAGEDTWRGAWYRVKWVTSEGVRVDVSYQRYPSESYVVTRVDKDNHAMDFASPALEKQLTDEADEAYLNR